MATQLGQEALIRLDRAIKAGMPRERAERAAQIFQEELNVIGQLQPQPQAQPQKRPFRVTDLIPVAGGLLGGTLGAPLGPVGVIGGGATGSGIGESIRQLITGEPSVGRIASEAGLGLLGGVGGEVLGAGLRVGARVLGRSASPVARIATNTVDAPTRRLSTEAVGRGITKFGERAAIGAIRPTPSQLAKFSRKHGEDMATTAIRSKIVGKSAEQITDDVIRPLQKSFDEIVNKKAAVISTQRLVDDFLAKAAPLADSPVSEDRVLFNRLVNKMNELEKRYGNNVVFQKVTSDRRIFDSKVNYNRLVNDPLEFGENKFFADLLRESIQKRADELGLTGVGGRGIKEIGKELNKLYDIADIVGKQSNVGRGVPVPSFIDLIGFGVGTTAGGVGTGAIVPVVTRLLRTSAGQQILSKSSLGVGGRLSQPVSPRVRLGTTAAGQAFAQPLVRSQRAEVQPTSTEAILPLETDQSPEQIISDLLGQEDDGETVREKIQKAMILDLAINRGRNRNALKTIAEFSAPEKKALNVSQRQDLIFGARIKQSNQIFNKLERQSSDLFTGRTSFARNIPERLKGEDQKRLEQAESNFINALLRRESGATIQPEEFRSAFRQYFPLPGDTPAVLRQKKANRQLVEGLLLSGFGGSGSRKEPTSVSVEDTLLDLGVLR